MEFIKKSTHIHGNKYSYELVEYINNRTDVKIYCNKCREYFLQKPNIHLANHGCKKCADNNILTNNEFIERAKKIHQNRYDYTNIDYINNHTKIKIFCTKCEKHFLQNPNNHLNGSGCPNCRESKGEKTISNILDTYNIKYIRQHVFIDCIYKRKLPFDFYLIYYSICIEFDGSQHFEIKEHWGGIKGYDEIILKDNIKNKLLFK